MTKWLGTCVTLLVLPIAVACSQTQVAAPVANPPDAAEAAAGSSRAGAVEAAEATATEARPRASVGGDRDVKGCVGSAGYAYSHLLGKCIRIFEDGIRMEPKAKSLDKTQSAFAIFAPGDETQAEIFLPGRAPAILARDGAKDAWRDGAYVLTRAKRLHTLAEVSGTKLYEGSAR